MAFIRIGAAYINASDIRMINPAETGTEEDKKFGIEVITRNGNFRTYCEGRTERNTMLQRALALLNSPDENMIEIRKQLAAMNSKINSLDRKIYKILEKLEKMEGEK